MLHFLRSSISSKFIFNPSNRNPFTLSFLIYSFGFSSQPSSSSTTSQHPNLVIDFFKSYGFSDSKALAIVQSSPSLYRSNPSRSLQPKVDFFKSKGFSNSELRRIIASCPCILCRSLQREIIPCFDFFTNMFQSERTFIKVIIRYPGILYGLDKYSLKNIRLLREGGVPESYVIKFIEYFPRPLKASPKRFEESVLEVKQLGFDPTRSLFIVAVATKLSLSRSTWARKEGVYKKWGWGGDDILAAFRVYPFSISISEEKIEAIMDYLVNELGFKSSDVVKCPTVLSLSLEKRITPRGSVVLVLLSKGLVKKMNLRISSIFKCDEKCFLKRFVSCHKEEADELLKLYQAKLSLAR